MSRVRLRLANNIMKVEEAAVVLARGAVAASLEEDAVVSATIQGAKVISYIQGVQKFVTQVITPLIFD